MLDQRHQWVNMDITSQLHIICYPFRDWRICFKVNKKIGLEFIFVNLRSYSKTEINME